MSTNAVREIKRQNENVRVRLREWEGERERECVLTPPLPPSFNIRGDPTAAVNMSTRRETKHENSFSIFLLLRQRQALASKITVG